MIFITGHGDVPMAVNAMKSGAADFIQKPFRDQDLIDRIHKALARDLDTRKWRAQEKVIRERLALLTPREAEVMQRVVKGHANKVIAMDLGVSQRTVELHRARVMHKLKMRSLADLVSASARSTKWMRSELAVLQPLNERDERGDSQTHGAFGVFRVLGLQEVAPDRHRAAAVCGSLLPAVDVGCDGFCGKRPTIAHRERPQIRHGNGHHRGNRASAFRFVAVTRSAMDRKERGTGRLVRARDVARESEAYQSDR